MKAISSELSTYSDMVLAQHREVCGDKSGATINWDSFSSLGCYFSPHAVKVGKVPEELQEIGFMPMFIYDKQHFRDNMYPLYDRPHAHGASIEDMLALPEIVAHPTVIVSERTDVKRKDSGDNEYDVLVFLCNSQREGKQSYYLAAVQPQDYYDGILTRGYASKIVSYYEIDADKFNAILRDVTCGQRSLLYFNHDAYARIMSPTKPIEFSNTPSVAIHINGYYRPRSNLHEVMNDHKRAEQNAVTAVLSKCVLDKRISGTSFPLFTDAYKVMENGAQTIKELMQARSLMIKVCSMTQDRALRLRAIEMTDRMFADAYAKLMAPQMQKKYLDIATRQIDQLELDTESDVTYLYDLAEKLSKSTPTLKNRNIVFSGAVTNHPSVLKAQEISGQLEVAMETHLAKLVEQKLEKFHQLDRPHER